MTVKDPELQKVVDDLKRLRDEVRVHLHLAKADAKDEWERLEHEWAQLPRKLEATGRELERTAGDVKAAFKLMAEDLREGYRRIRASM